ncbi:hypothetical protein [Streptomyces laculatispora]|uniref:hypothetical protein n=1 Tax=Streptomyces laculatispora TaxID=887464 RepID=UPI001A93B2E6|nr:hypothetical protein [Streptomyces laculatispora]MBO0916898.1 hypothetical protein [Streptomyces laculatispora]
MPLPRPARLAPRGVRAVVVLAAVFASGWYLGQPVVPAPCEAPPRTVRYSDHLAADTPQGGCDGRARLLAWLAGDLR